MSEQGKDRKNLNTVYTVLVIVAGIMICILVGFLVRPKGQWKTSSIPEFNPAITFSTPTLAEPTQMPTPMPTRDPNTFPGDWEFLRFEGKQADGDLAGNDIGWFRSTIDPGDIIRGVCACARCTAPKEPKDGQPGDLYRWDSFANKLVPYAGNIQIFWYPSR